MRSWVLLLFALAVVVAIAHTERIPNGGKRSNDKLEEKPKRERKDEKPDKTKFKSKDRKSKNGLKSKNENQRGERKGLTVDKSKQKSGGKSPRGKKIPKGRKSEMNHRKVIKGIPKRRPQGKKPLKRKGDRNPKKIHKSIGKQLTKDCPGTCLEDREDCQGRLEGKKGCSGGDFCCVQGNSRKSGTKRFCSPLKPCNKLKGECRKKKTGCNANEIMYKSNKKKTYCTKKSCICCVVNNCSTKKKCSKLNGICQMKEDPCDGTFKKSKKFCNGKKCGCCIPGSSSTCKPKKTCSKDGGTCQALSAICAGEVKQKNDKGKKYCKGKTCGCCLPKTTPQTPLITVPTTVVTAPPTTVPTTNGPTTAGPIITVPTTNGPTTAGPIITVPTTNGPTTAGPTTIVPTTNNPTTAGPTTSVPTTNSPTTAGPTTTGPTTTGPTTTGPTTPGLTTIGPTATGPTTTAPTTNGPTTNGPTTTGPTTTGPTTAGPTTTGPTTTGPTATDPTTTGPTTTLPTTTPACSFTRPYCPDCGVATINVADTRIVNGEDASPNEFPYQVVIIPTILDSQYQCGGSIIKKNWILTAAHCFFDTNEVKADQDRIIVGYGNIKLNESTFVAADSFIVHENYNPNATDFDIALVKLQTDLNYESDASIQPICLGEEADIPFGGKAVASGWGTLQFQGSTSNVLQEVALDIITNDVCATKAALPADTTSVICALTLTKDTCQGDSGGPLVAQVCPNRWVQVGIVSYGFKCAEPDNPGVYTRVSAFKNWVDTNTGSTDC